MEMHDYAASDIYGGAVLHRRFQVLDQRAEASTVNSSAPGRQGQPMQNLFD
jgi:hypothetical protein